MNPSPSRRSQLLWLALNPFSLIIILGGWLLITNFSWSGLFLWTFAFVNWGLGMIAYAVGLFGYHTPLTGAKTAKDLAARLDYSPASLGLTDQDEIIALCHCATYHNSRNQNGSPDTGCANDHARTLANNLRTFPEGWGNWSERDHDEWWERYSRDKQRYEAAILRLQADGWLVPTKQFQCENPTPAQVNLQLSYSEISRRLRASKHSDIPVEGPVDLSAPLADADMILREADAHLAELEKQRDQIRAPFEKHITHMKAELEKLQEDADDAATEIDYDIKDAPRHASLRLWADHVRVIKHIQEHGLDALVDSNDNGHYLDTFAFTSNIMDVKNPITGVPKSMRVSVFADRKGISKKSKWDATVDMSDLGINVKRSGADQAAVLAEALQQAAAQLASARPQLSTNEAVSV